MTRFARFRRCKVDQTDVEDLDTEAENHAADETRYACIVSALDRVCARRRMEGMGFPKRPDEMTINEPIDRQKPAASRH